MGSPLERWWSINICKKMVAENEQEITASDELKEQEFDSINLGDEELNAR